MDTNTTPTVPAAGAAPAATAVPFSRIVYLTWAAPDDGGSAITGYRIYREGAPFGTSVAPAYTDMTASPSPTTYAYSALNAAGEGALSPPKTV